MKKVITYGTFDLLHQGHLNLLEKAKSQGDYLIVGITSDDFDMSRGKVSVQQPIADRVDGVRKTGLADEIIIEEYEGQKIEDILKYDIDVFAIGSDWIGKFDYLKKYCEVVYLPRTEGISSTELREKNEIRIGVVGYTGMAKKFVAESKAVNGVKVTSIFSPDQCTIDLPSDHFEIITDNYEEMIDNVDAVYVLSRPELRCLYAERALKCKKHVLCESPVSLNKDAGKRLFELAEQNDCVFMEAIKTAYAVAFERLCFLALSGGIGEIKSIDSTCTSLANVKSTSCSSSLLSWGPIGLLPVFKLLGTENYSARIISAIDQKTKKDYFTEVQFIYDKSLATVKVGNGIKSEGELIVSGTNGYIFVPSPWWKTDYYETRFENQESNKRFFFKLPGEGIQYEIAAFSKTIRSGRTAPHIDKGITLSICALIEQMYQKENYFEIH